MVRIFIFALLLVSSFNIFALENLTASVDRNPVIANEPFILTVTADASLDANELDTSALLSNFVVGRTSTSSQTQIINGEITRMSSWKIVLVSRETGQKTIPSFSIDGVASRPINLTIVAAGQATGNQQKDLFIDVDLSSDEIYLQQSVSYTIKLYIGLDLQSGSLTQPTIENANIEQQGQDKESTEIVNGRRYRVISRQFSIQPQRSGEYTLNAVTFTGEASVGRRSAFSLMGRTKTVTAAGPEITLTVKPVPENYAGHWLPVELLNLNEEWQPDTESFNVGEPITRTVTITGLGVKGEQIPELTVNYPDNIKVYPEQPTVNTVVRDGNTIGQRTESVALIPSRPGTITFPAIEVTWFNTITKRTDVATLPARTITVTGDALTSTPPPVQPDIQIQNDGPTISAATPVPAVSVTPDSPGWLTWLFFGLWFATALGWIIHVRLIRQRPTDTIQQTPTHLLHGSSDALWSAFKQSCQESNRAAALTTLLAWGKQSIPHQHITSLEQLMAVFNDQTLNQSIQDAWQSGYSKNTTNWNGQSLYRAAENMKRQSLSSTKTTLHSLYPA